jgi:endonuclease/exonuclease/phosphatase family metal-dependent hydrolase
MSVLYHHNLQVFSGGTAREPDFLLSYARLLQNLQRAQRASPRGGGQRPITVAGFTEVRNADPLTRDSLLAFGRSLNPQIADHLFFRVGRTALSGFEWVCLVWDPAITVRCAGVVQREVRLPARDPVWVGHGALPNPAIAGNRQLSWPNGQPDTRGLAWIVADFPNGVGTFIVAFFHNIYAVNDRALVYGSLGNAAAAIRTELGGLLPAVANAPLVFGGDYNVHPNHVGAGPQLRPLAARIPPRPGAPARAPAYYRTTGKNCYDFWLYSDPRQNAPLQNALPRVHHEVRDIGVVSDHAAITLELA